MLLNLCCQSTLSTKRSSVIMTHVFRKCKGQRSGNLSRQLFLTNKAQIRDHIEFSFDMKILYQITMLI